MNQELSIEQSELESNYENWRSLWIGPFQSDSAVLLGALITHTFPAEKTWGDTPGESVPVYEHILFRDEALLSCRIRESAGSFLPGESRRTGLRWRELGLDRYVSAYIGIHDPYYADSEYVSAPAFGLFLSRDGEAFPQCIATRRDVASKEASVSVTLDFLLAKDAQELARCESLLAAVHGGDFWHYWGAPDYWSRDPTYLRQMWEWKYELHFLDRVQVRDVNAILWPTVMDADIVAGGQVASPITERASAFRANWPDCKILHYDWSTDDPHALARASYTVARYVMKFGDYPATLEDADALIAT